MLSGNDQTDIILYLYIGIILSSLLTGKMLVFIFVFFNILTESNILFSVVSFLKKQQKQQQTNKQAMSVFFFKLFCHPLVAEKTVILYVVFVGMLLSAIICIIVI